MRKIYYFLFVVLLFCFGCGWHIKPNTFEDTENKVVVERYDRIQSLYLTTGDFSALQQMNTNYPMQTRTLIEDVLKIGKVNDSEINSKFLNFYQDTVLQSLINEVEQQYANMDDINKDLSSAFKRLKTGMPDIEFPEVYSQIGALDQSIIVGNNMLGISLDKYLGTEYSLYKKYYPYQQRRLMERDMIVPDCIAFFILSLYPMPSVDSMYHQVSNDIHMGKIQWIVNNVTSRSVFSNRFVSDVDDYMKCHKHLSNEQLLRAVDYQSIVKRSKEC